MDLHAIHGHLVQHLSVVTEGGISSAAFPDASQAGPFGSARATTSASPLSCSLMAWPTEMPPAPMNPIRTLSAMSPPSLTTERPVLGPRKCAGALMHPAPGLVNPRAESRSSPELQATSFLHKPYIRAVSRVISLGQNILGGDGGGRGTAVSASRLPSVWSVKGEEDPCLDLVEEPC